MATFIIYLRKARCRNGQISGNFKRLTTWQLARTKLFLESSWGTLSFYGKTFFFWSARKSTHFLISLARDTPNTTTCTVKRDLLLQFYPVYCTHIIKREKDFYTTRILYVLLKRKNSSFLAKKKKIHINIKYPLKNLKDWF